MNIESLEKPHIYIRNKIKENFYARIGRRPDLIYALTKFTPDGEKVRIDYSLGIPESCSISSQLNLGVLPEVYGEYCRFCYSGKPMALNNHVIYIYTKILPLLGLARRDAPDFSIYN